MSKGQTMTGQVGENNAKVKPWQAKVEETIQRSQLKGGRLLDFLSRNFLENYLIFDFCKI